MVELIVFDAIKRTLKMFSSKTVCSFVFFLHLILVSSESTVEEIRQHVGPSKKLESSILLACCPGYVPRSYPMIYCYEAVKKTQYNLWMTAQVFISLGPDEYELYQGYDEDDLIRKFLMNKTTFKYNYFWEQEVIFNPFNDTCFGIVTPKDYEVTLKVKKADIFALLLFFGGMFLSYRLRYLAREPFSFYLIGISGGVLLSLLLAFIIIFLMLLKGTAIATVTAGSSTIDWIMSFLRMMHVRIYITGYAIASAIVSFCICYRHGPVTSPWGIYMLQRCLQIVGGTILFFSSYNKGSILLIIFVMDTLTYYPSLKIYLFKISKLFLYAVIINLEMVIMFLFGWIQYVLVILWELSVKVALRLKYMIFGYPPPSVQLLTSQQFHQQGQIETDNALNQLFLAYHNHTIDPYEALYRMNAEARVRMLRFLTRRQDHVTIQEWNEHYETYGHQISDDEDEVNNQDHYQNN